MEQLVPPAATLVIFSTMINGCSGEEDKNKKDLEDALKRPTTQLGVKTLNLSKGPNAIFKPFSSYNHDPDKKILIAKAKEGDLYHKITVEFEDSAANGIEAGDIRRISVDTQECIGPTTPDEYCETLQYERVFAPGEYFDENKWVAEASGNGEMVPSDVLNYEYSWHTEDDASIGSIRPGTTPAETGQDIANLMTVHFNEIVALRRNTNK